METVLREYFGLEQYIYVAFLSGVCVPSMVSSGHDPGVGAGGRGHAGGAVGGGLFRRQRRRLLRALAGGGARAGGPGGRQDGLPRVRGQVRQSRRGAAGQGEGGRFQREASGSAGWRTAWK